MTGTIQTTYINIYQLLANVQDVFAFISLNNGMILMLLRLLESLWPPLSSGGILMSFPHMKMIGVISI